MRAPLATAVLALAGATAVLTASQPRDLVAAARQALGGDAALSAITSFTITGSLSRDVGGHGIDSGIEIDCVLPDKFVEIERRTMSLGPLGDADTITTSGFNGDDAIYDVVTIGRIPTPPSTPNRTALPYRMKLAQLMLPMFAASSPGAPLTLERVEGMDAMDATGLGDRTWRVFFDPATHLPARLTWMAKPIVSFSASSGTRVRLPDEPTENVPWEIVASGYKLENGLNWPRTFTTTYDGKRYETRRFSKIKINPVIDLKKFKTIK